MIPPNKFEMMWNIWGEILVLNSLIVLLQIDENVISYFKKTLIGKTAFLRFQLLKVKCDVQYQTLSSRYLLA